jgi:hypothetical protein
MCNTMLHGMRDAYYCGSNSLSILILKHADQEPITCLSVLVKQTNRLDSNPDYLSIHSVHP